MLLSLLSRPLGGALAASLLVAVLELVALGSCGAAPDLGVTVVSLHAALGLLIGLSMWLTEYLADRLMLRPVAASILRTLPALPALVWLGRTLFQGASAATLPGASWGPLWVPAVGGAVIAGALLVAGALLSRPGRGRRALVAGACLAAAAVLELGNRRLFQAEYPDLHAFLIPASCVLVAAGLRVAAAGGGLVLDRRGAAAPVIAGAAAGALVLLGLGLSLAGGLDEDDSRWLLATRGNHGRHLVRLVRDRFDGDGDGFSRALGGGDCDDGDQRINPGAADLPANRIDEDCDGTDARMPVRPPAEVKREADAVAAFRDLPARADLLRRAASWNLLILSVDSLRADAVTDTPANRKAFPNIFALFDRSRRFTRAFAPSSGTDVSVSSVMTGLVNPFQPLDTTLFEAIRRGGRATHAVLPREVLRYAGKNLLLRGVDRHDVIVNDQVQRDVSTSTTSIATTRRGLAALDRMARSGVFMLWLHYFDVHEHLQIEPGDADLSATAARRGFDLSTREGKYRALLAVVDREIGAVMAELERRKLTDSTAIVFFSDHGESLGEDERLPDNHGLYLYHPLVHVPVALHVPGGPTGASDEPVTLLDLTPTILELLGLPPWQGLAGRSLLPHLVAGAPAALLSQPRPLPLNESDQWGVIQWPDKLLVRPKDNLVELYDLARDPGERQDRAAREPETVRRLKTLYQSFPPVSMDRTRKGREMRDRLALPPRRR